MGKSAHLGAWVRRLREGKAALRAGRSGVPALPGDQ